MGISDHGDKRVILDHMRKTWEPLNEKGDDLISVLQYVEANGLSPINHIEVDNSVLINEEILDVVRGHFWNSPVD